MPEIGETVDLFWPYVFI